MPATTRFSIKPFFIFCWLINIVLLSQHWIVATDSIFLFIYNAMATCSYGLLYLVPALTLAWVVQKFWPETARKPLVAAAVSVLMAASTVVILFGDLQLFALYGFHINGFVWNLVTTPGGIDSLGAGSNTTRSFAILIAATYLLFGLVYALLHFGWVRQNAVVLRVASLRGRSLAWLFFAAFMVNNAGYAVADLDNNGAVLSSAERYPLYQPLTLRHTAEKFGYIMKKNQVLIAGNNKSAQRLQYPLKPLVYNEAAPRLNVVMLISESMRWDLLTDEIMPNATRFSQKALRFENHYSSGNNTRPGLFGLFYGLYGNYWNAFLYEQRSPLLFDVLARSNYALSAYTSAKFTYPEFDKTIFVSFSPDRMFQNVPGAAWERDISNVTHLLDDIGTRDKSRPFFSFMFFESTHANYDFPEEAVIRQDYLHEINYAKLDHEMLSQKREQMKNRYINAAHHIDAQIGRVVDYLEREGLLENTVILIAGDHGEEFMENGRWGHNSTFSDYQTRTPFVLYAPGKAPKAYQKLSSHLDFTSTLLPLLGVENPVDDYGLGHDLLADEESPYVVTASWTHIGYIDSQFKYYIPIETGLNAKNILTDKTDQPIADDKAFLETHRAQVMELLNKQRRFMK
jgi:uncharacterized protein